MRIAKGTFHWILIPLMTGFIFLSLTIGLMSQLKYIFFLLSGVSFFLMVLFSIFFRDPERIIGNGVVSPADGKIQWIDHIKNKYIGEYTRISTFMNIYDVHVNRMPLDGVIKDIVHQSGSHIPAFKKESERNEQITITIDTAIGIVKICQIAGTFGRRIVSYVKVGETIKKGERIGIILFGSRVDLYLPSKKIKSICVKIRDKVLAGEDVIAYIYD